MDVYRAGTQVTLSIPLTDINGNILAPSSVDFRVVDESGAEIVATTATSFALGDSSVDVIVSAAHNTLSDGVLRGLRVIQLIITDDSGAVAYIDTPYLIELESTLVVLGNSYQTLHQAILNSIDIANIDYWLGATDQQRTAALVSAFHRIGKLRFSPYRGESGSTTDTASFDYADNDINCINELTLEQFNALPARFLACLNRAQIIEADSLLGGDPVAKKREEGLMADSVGQSSIMFRPGKPISMGVAKRTLEELSGYLLFNLGIGRR